MLLDGGIRRGNDVVKAIALGARAVMIGRAYLWGLAANGQASVENVLDILRERDRLGASWPRLLVPRRPERGQPRGPARLHLHPGRLMLYRLGERFTASAGHRLLNRP